MRRSERGSEGETEESKGNGWAEERAGGGLTKPKALLSSSSFESGMEGGRDVVQMEERHIH